VSVGAHSAGFSVGFDILIEGRDDLEIVPEKTLER
jgi:hypothetical protein